MIGTFELRALSVDDIDDWAELLKRVNAADPRVVAWDPEVLRTRFTDDFAVEGPRSLAGAWLDGQLVGYARVRQDGGAESRLLRLAGAVDPAVRRQGIGTQIMLWSLATAKAWTDIFGPVTVIADAADVEEDLQTILTRVRFQKSATFVEMARPLAADDLPAAEHGLELAPYTADLELAAQAVHLAVRGPGTEPEFEAILAKPSFRPELSRVALDPESRAVLGYLLVQNSPGDSQGWIDGIAVLPRERGRNVTAALVSSALQGFVDAGLTSAGLGVVLTEAVEQDLTVCDQLGFAVSTRWSRFVRSLEEKTDSAVKLSVTEVADLPEDELREVAGWLAARNSQAKFYSGYLGIGSAQLQAELVALSPGAVIAQLHHAEKRVAVMMAEWDPDSARVWLHGPWAPIDQVADALFRALVPHIPSEKTELEVFCDQSNKIITNFAARNGLVPDGVFDTLAVARREEIAEPVNPVRPYEDMDFAALDKLHYNTHPDSNLTAERILAEKIPLWIAFHGDEVAGYLTCRFSAGDSVARIEHMGVEPSLPEDTRTQLRIDLLNVALREMFNDPKISQVEMARLSAKEDTGAGAVGFELIRSLNIFRTVAKLTTHVPTN